MIPCLLLRSNLINFIISVDESNIQNIQSNLIFAGKNQKKFEKQVLPEIKVNIILNENNNVHKIKNFDSDDSDNENNKRNLVTFLKLPPVIKENTIKYNKAGSNYFNSNEFKNSIKHNLSNQSIEININTQYSKRNFNQNMSKKVN